MPATNKPLTRSKKRIKEVARDLTVMHPSAVAKKYGVVPSAITRFKSRDDVQKIIREQSELLLQLTPDVTDFYRDVIHAGKNALKTAMDETEENERKRANRVKIVAEAVKVSENVGKATGLLPSHLGNLTVNNVLFSDSPSLSPVLSRLLSACVPSLSPDTGFIPVPPSVPEIEVEYEGGD